MKGKRKKDEAIHLIRGRLEDLVDAVETYREQLEDELGRAEAEPEPYDHLVRALQRQIAHARDLEQALDENAWPQIVSLANGSAYVEHTRSRDYF